MAAPSRNSTSNGRRRECAQAKEPQSNCCIWSSAASSRTSKASPSRISSKVELVGVYPNYAAAYAVWKQKAQQTVDNAEMRYFVVHLHRLLEPDENERVSPLPGAEPPAKWIDRPGVRNFIGTLLIGSYIRFVRLTSRVVADPADFWDSARRDHWPAIAVSWHGQSNLAYVVMPEPSRVALLISMHPDGQMMGAMARSLGYQTVEGSGASERQRHGTGGLAAFRNMLKTLKSGTTLFATADIPPEPGRHVSLGMIALARRSGPAGLRHRHCHLAAQDPRAGVGQDAAQLPVLDHRLLPVKGRST